MKQLKMYIIARENQVPFAPERVPQSTISTRSNHGKKLGPSNHDRNLPHINKLSDYPLKISCRYQRRQVLQRNAASITHNNVKSFVQNKKMYVRKHTFSYSISSSKQHTNRHTRTRNPNRNHNIRTSININDNLTTSLIGNPIFIHNDDETISYTTSLILDLATIDIRKPSFRTA